MATPTVANTIEKVKEILKIDGAWYDSELTTMINASMSKLDNEGVTHAKIDVDDEMLFSDYILCIATHVAQEIDLGIDIKNLMNQYLQRVQTLRLKVSTIEL